ncbi:hypothetical protein psal_cds_946 [Pandoravirus salinus]|uniref:DUF5902 domain-containing protein n=1 Tax=Pandoravirus salinus TaxID=1349410 RepID=S4W3A9_9VIRU|nr:hypothetical protein psal_cds_946 [Pandoravirus salinus]AGO85092.2 hypothetical protein psal_cds_946 [Pandoravirus salinus]
MDALPPEILDMIIAAVDIGDVDTLRAICSTNRTLYGLCRAPLIDWRSRYPDIVRLVPDKVADTTRLMSPLDVARFVRAAGFFKKKCALYALRLVVSNEAKRLTRLNQERDATNPPDDAGPVQDPRPSLVALAGGAPRPYTQTTVSDLETWFKTAPPALGFYGFSPEDERYVPWPVPGSPPTYVIGPLGPKASVVDRPPKLVYVKPYIHYREHEPWPLDSYVEQATYPWMLDEARRQINATLAKAIVPPQDAMDAVRRIARALSTGAAPDRRDLALALPASEVLEDLNELTTLASAPGEAPFVSLRAQNRLECNEIDLWAAYPEAEIYIVTTANMPAPGSRRNYKVFAVSLPLD